MSVLICDGAHAADIRAIWERNNHSPLRVYDHNPIKHSIPAREVYDEYCYIGINDPQERARIAHKYFLDGATPLIDRDAVIGRNCHISGGCVIAPSAVLLTDVWLGRHTHINYGATMTRCSIGAFGTVSPGATICGNVEIGIECMIGAGAVICDRVRIGNQVTVAAGAIVPPESIIPDGTTVIGVWKNV